MKNREIIKFSLFEGYDNANIGIEKEQQENIIKFLKKLQANEMIVYMKIWNFHWNAVGKNFTGAHKHFNDLYDEFFEIIDNTSERIRELGGRPIGALKNIIEESDIEEYKDDKSIPSIEEMYKNLLEDFETLIKNIRKFLEEDNKVDNGTTNYLEGLISSLEKDAWMIRSHIE